MENEIKFRVYVQDLPENKWEMNYFDLRECHTDWIAHVWTQGYQIMQCIGLKIGKKEIYEGDCIKNKDGEVGVVEFYNGRFCVRYKTGVRLTFIYENISDLSLVGNIYQNPEFFHLADLENELEENETF